MDEQNDIVRRAEGRVGSVIGAKWTLDALLGVGGMAAVYAATHRNKKRAAVKILHPELSVDSMIRARFLREGYVANTVAHPGVVMVDDDEVTSDGSAYLVMELLEGESLKSRWIGAGYRLPTDEVLELVHQLLDALVAAHDKGVLHRDLKPENLFVTRAGVLKVLDFGIARLRTGVGATPTQTGDVMGTPSFMSPEQARGRWTDVDHRTDLWSVGAIMFTLLTGELVHGGETVTEALVMAVMHPAPRIGERLPDLPAALAELIDKALAFDKHDRFADAREMQQAVAGAYRQLTGRELVATVSASASPADDMSDVGRGATIDSDVMRGDVARAATLPTAGGVSAPNVSTGRGRGTWLVAALALVGGAAVAYLFVGPEPAPVESQSPAPAISADLAAHDEATGDAKSAPAESPPGAWSQAIPAPSASASAVTRGPASSRRLPALSSKPTPTPKATIITEPPAPTPDPLDRRQ